MLDECLADVSARALHDVEDTRRQPSVDRQLGHQHSGHRGLLGRLEDHRVTCRERRGDKGEDRRWPVPRHDQANDPDGLAHLRHVELAGYRGDGALQLRGPSAEVLDAIDGELHDEAGVGAQQACIEHVDLGEQLAALGDEGGHVAQHPLFRHRRLIAPAAVLEGGASGTGRPIHVVDGSCGDLGNDDPGRRVDDVEGRAVEGADAFALDDVSEDVVLDGLTGLRGNPFVDDGHDVVSDLGAGRRGRPPHVLQAPCCPRLTS